MFTEEMRRNPYPIYDQLRSGGVMHFAPADLWMIFDYDGVKRALTDQESFSSKASPTRNLSFEWLLFMDPPRHTQMRAIVSKAFTPRSIQELEPRIRLRSKQLLDALVPRGRFDLVADYAVPLPMMVIAEMLGVPITDWPRLREWSEAIINLGTTIVGDAEAKRAASEEFLRSNAEMQAYLDEQMKLRRGDDLIARLVEAEVDGERLNEMEILRFVQLLLAAGTETTTNLIDNAMLCLLEHPRELARLKEDLSLLASAIEEVLRYRSPAQAMFRATRREVELSGQKIPAGKLVLPIIGSANRDPRCFEDANRFDIARNPNPHLAFGHGIHFCIGAPLSRLEAKVALADLLSRMNEIQRVSDEAWPPRQAFHVHGPVSLPIAFTPAAE